MAKNSNHFFFPYFGNKRNEINRIMTHISFEKVTTIIEPYCGSCSMSYFINKAYPDNDIKFILNDNDPFLIELLSACKDETKTNKINEDVNKFITQFNEFKDDETRKPFYKQFIKDNKNNIVGYIVSHKYYNISAGMYPNMKRLKQIKPFNMREYPVYDFIKSDRVEIKQVDAMELIKEYSNKKECLLLCDPPYFSSFNGAYDNPTMNSFYDFFYHNNMKKMKAQIIIIVQDIWMNSLLFGKYIVEKYGKKYESTKRKLEHIIIVNHK